MEQDNKDIYCILLDCFTPFMIRLGIIIEIMTYKMEAVVEWRLGGPPIIDNEDCQLHCR